jgi:peptidoglycan/LPS O-acetylase OafA/YrhL
MSTFELTLVGIFFGACIAMAVALHNESPAHRVLASHFLRFFGKYSYGLYVCHLPIIAAFEKVGLNCDHLFRILHSDLLALVVVNGAGFAVSITIAFASWHLYEKQWLKLKDLRVLQCPNQFSAHLRRVSNPAKVAA